eukprot:CAMPEP_0205807338 /NCGR_PEP_ID=MMETSP0205-20121125/11065_1 /ASSEMBLY_ACC=CAM_ASM_000278 /TAXON_ID=36767 /ORGANISM="Euplotes focardii, Strain TN1" /LENGTH=55 /DNA_ID=CAMNT_0053081463 /DNA_START=774 /DNA_END=938 /DNA_ORIENTATION=+
MHLEGEEEEEDIRFSIHGESSVDQSSENVENIEEELQEDLGNTKSNSIRIPEFKV